MSKKKITVFMFCVVLFAPLYFSPSSNVAWGQEELEELELDENEDDNEDFDEGELENESSEDIAAEESDDEEFDDEEFDEESEETTEQLAEKNPQEKTKVTEEAEDDELELDEAPLEPLTEEEIIADEAPVEQPVDTFDSVSEPIEEKTEYVDTALVFEDESSKPDLEYEAHLYNTYLNYNSSGVSGEEWSMLLLGREAELYKIQKGDTLWGVSELFFGDGSYWPKIWSLNGSITDPHLIRKGHTIGFIMGNDESAPSFTVTEGDGSNLQNNTAVSLNNSTTSERESSEDDGPEIPPPSIHSRPTIKRVPPSLPEWHSADSSGEYGESGLSIIPRKKYELKQVVSINAFIDSEKPDKLGQLVEVETGYKIAALYQYVYVKMEPGVARVGDKFLVVRDQGLIQIPKGVDSEGDEHRFQIQGEIKLIDFSTLDRDDEEEDHKLEHFRALITGMVEPVTSGSIIVKGSIKDHDVSMTGARSRVVAQIIGGTLATNRRLFTTGSLVFLNRGSLAGLTEGSILSIRANRKSRKEQSKVVVSHRPVGWLKIVKTSLKYSTAVIVQAWDSINAGDYTGLGDLLPRGVNVGIAEMEAKESKPEFNSADLLEAKNLKTDPAAELDTRSMEDESEADFEDDDSDEDLDEAEDVE